MCKTEERVKEGLKGREKKKGRKKERKGNGGRGVGQAAATSDRATLHLNNS